MNLPNFSKVFYLDPVANTILPPQLMLTTRSFKPLGLIKYTNWNFSLVANGMDEFTFDVYKPEDITEDMDPKKKLILTYEKKVWENLVDLKLIYIQDYGRFEISVNYTDNTKTVKSVHAVSLECELAEAKLYDFHVNDDEAMATMEVNEYNKVNFDSQGNFIPTTLCNFSDPEHSLIHRVLADKAPHWKVGNQEWKEGNTRDAEGYFTPFVTFAEDEDCELSKEFQRTYTCNGESIYEFLTGTVANECNVVFVFDTINRVINCYSLTDCILQHNKEKMASAIGEDTNVFVSKEKLANEISITSKKDNVKNCFRVEGGDDYINAMVAVANVNGTNYITQFSQFQYDDMSDELKKALPAYAKAVKEAQPVYEKKYLELCVALDELYELESGKMPSINTDDTTSSNELNSIETKLKTYGTTTKYTTSSHVGLTNGIESLAKIYTTSNFDVEVVSGSTSYNETSSTWSGELKVIDKSMLDTEVGKISTKNIKVLTTDDEIRICEQKIEKALAKGDMISFKFVMDEYIGDDYYISDAEYTRIKNYLYDNYCLNRLISFYDAYESCVSTLIDMGKNKPAEGEEDSPEYNFYLCYVRIRNAIGEVKNQRQQEVDEAQALVDKLNKECADYQSTFEMKTWFIKNYGKEVGESCYLEYCSYRREDTYSNPNYISDGLTDSECIKKAKELLEVATKEIKKACVLQRTLSIDMNNLFMMEEFAPLYDKFSMFNYIRVATDDEILKLRLIGIDINGSSLSSVDVTFSEQIESVDGSINDLQSILEQAKSNNSAFPSTIRQAKQGEEAARIIGSIRKNGLIAAQTLISNADNNEVTYGGFGILCKNQGDSGNYGLKQLRVIGNGIYLTKDAWETVEMCIGEITYTDKDGNQYEKYGIIADTIIAGTIVGGNAGGDGPYTYWNLDTGEFVMASSSKIDTGEKDEEGNPIYSDLNSFIVNIAEGYFNSHFEDETGFSDLIQDVEMIKGEVYVYDEEGNLSGSKLDITAEGIREEITSTQQIIDANKNDADGEISSLKTQVANIEKSSQELSMQFSTTIENGVDRVTTSTGYTFNEDGMMVAKTNSEMATQITDNGMTVSRSGNVVLTANAEGVDAENLHATTYLIIGNSSRFEDYINEKKELRTGCFWIGDIPYVTSISATYSGGNVDVGTSLSQLVDISVTATYSDGSTEIITDYTLFGTIKEGDNTIIVTYKGKSDQIIVKGIANNINISGGGSNSSISSGSDENNNELVIKTGTITGSSTFDTELSSIKQLVLWRTTCNTTGIMNASYNEELGTQYVYCNTWGEYIKGVSEGSTAPTIENGTVVWNGSGSAGISGGDEYTWVAVGTE